VSVREELAQRLGVDESVQTSDARCAELRSRLQEIAPGVRAGDADACAEFDRIEAAIAEEKRRRRIDELADAEEAEREAEAERQRVEAQRQQWQTEKAALEAKRDELLGKLERTVDTLVTTIAAALEHDAEAVQLAKKLSPGASSGRLKAAIEERLSRRFREVGVDAGGPLRGLAGSEPLGTRSCAVCSHPEREAIDAARAAGEPLSALAGRFGVSKSTLSRHGAH
jgi:Helix-turn-helix domain